MIASEVAFNVFSSALGVVFLAILIQPYVGLRIPWASDGRESFEQTKR
jgi:hypothetical protein